MPLPRLPAIVLAAAALLPVAAAPAGAQAPAYPNRPVRIIVPFLAGSATDIMGRVIGEQLQAKYGQPFVVENRPGASGNIGAAAVAKAPPDGYQLLLGPITIAANPALFRSMPFDTEKELQPISQIARFPLLLAVHNSLKVSTVGELVALARSRPRGLNAGSSGAGTSQHLAASLFEMLTETRFEHVYYRGSSGITVDFMNGDIHLTFGDMVSLLPALNPEKVTAIAVTSPVRSQKLPDLPTIAEAGVPGYEAAGWYGLFAPGGTGAEIVDQLYRDVAEALARPAVQERVRTLGGEPVGSSPAAFAAFVKSEMVRWATVAEKFQIRVD